MKPHRWMFAAVLIATAAPAAAYDLVANGNFQTGSLSSWTTFNQGSSGGQGSWYIHASGNGTYSGLPTSPPTGGFQAVADNNGRAAVILYQDVFIPATTRATLSLTLWYGTPFAYVNGSSLSPASTNQRVRIDLIPTSTPLLQTSSGVLQVIYATAPGSPAAFSPATITADVTALAGQSVRLRFALVGTQGGIIAGVDNVKLEVSPFAAAFSPLPAYAAAPSRWGDIDQDGLLDVVTTGTDATTGGIAGFAWRWFNSSWWSLSLVVPFTEGGCALGDIDRDGDLDFVGAGSTEVAAKDLVVDTWNDPYFDAPLHNTDLGSRYGTVDLGDADRDGKLDVLQTGLRNVFDLPMTTVDHFGASGELTSTAPSLPPSAYGHASWFDLDNDGRLDVAICGFGLAGVRLQDGSGDWTIAVNGLPGVTGGYLATGDFTRDGVDEIVITGIDVGTGNRLTKVFQLQAGSFVEMAAGSLPAVSDSWISVGDVDNDGWLDFALCGDTGGSRISRVYHNNGNGTFTDMNLGLPGVSKGSIELGDYEGDGDLDLLLSGHTGSNAMAQVYLNAPTIPNAAPTPPSNLSEVNTSESTFELRFGTLGTDDHLADDLLTHNFRVGTGPNAPDLVPPMSNLTTGRRLIPHVGEARRTTFRPLSLTKMGHGSLYWSVQTVDQAYRGSAWAPERVFTPGPTITAIQDIPGDQGRAVRLFFNRSMLDDESRTQYAAAGYNLWRLVTSAPTEQAIARDGVKLTRTAATARLLGETGRARVAAASVSRPLADSEQRIDLDLREWNGRVFTHSEGLTIESAFPPGTWEIVGSFYSTQATHYVVASSTVADSGSSGANNTTFIVSVHSTTPSVWFTSLPMSGHSVDNLAPAAPVGLTAAHHTGSGNHLAWQPAPEPDFASFHVYRGTTPGFVAGPSNLAAAPTSPDWTDPSYDAPVVYYKVSTLDHAGNESAAVPPSSTTAAEDQAVLEFGLESASPSPFGTSTRIRFALPRTADVRLDVFDPAGRRVRSLASGALAAGRHEATWDGSDAHGHRVSGGLYFYRLEAAGFTATRRVIFVP